MTAAWKAFVSPRADDLFASIAAVQDARELQEIDVPEAQREAHVAIDAAIFHASQRLPNPGARIALIKGDPGSGKTHVLTTALERAIRHSEDVYPVVLQLSAPVARADYERWLVEALFRELAARNFGRTRRPDGVAESPLRRATRRLLDRVPPEQAEALARAEEADDETMVTAALACGRALRKAARDGMSEEPPSDGFLAALILAGLGDWSAMAWLRRGVADARLAPLALPTPETPHERMTVLRDLGLALQIVGGVLAIGFDQVENTVRLGSEELFVHAMVQAVRLAESLVNAALVVAVLGPEYERIVAGSGAGAVGLPESDRYRIERERPAETYIRTPSVRILERVVAQRLAVLRTREGLPATDPPLDPLPAWFVARLADVRTVRFALREVNRLRERAVELDRVPVAADLDAPSQEEITAPLDGAEDFDKLWADYRDQQVSATDPVHLAGKAERLAWWVERAGEERAPGEGATATVRPPTAERDLFVVELEITGSGGARTRRDLGLCEAPHRSGKLTKQVEAFLAACTGTPVAVRSSPFPRARNRQPGDAVRAITARQGVVVELNELDWHLLGQARAFTEAHAAHPEFLRWRRRSQWSLQLLPDPGPLLPVAEVVAQAPPGAAFPLGLGKTLAGGADVRWDPYRPAPEQLPSFGFLVTGDAGSGKTHALRLLIDAACRQGLPVCVLDFRGDAVDAEQIAQHGIEVVDLAQRGLPFDPLVPPPPRADTAGAQAVSHAYDVAGILTRVFAFGPVQETQLRSAMVAAYKAAGIDPQQWLDPATVTWPSFSAVVDLLRADPKAATVAGPLDAFAQLGLLPRAGGPDLGALLKGRVVLRATGLPTDEIKRVVAELFILQLHGHTVRGDASRRLSRLIAMNESYRARHSRRLETLIRDGTAFGVAVALATPQTSDLSETMIPTLATRLHLMTQAEQRTWVVRQVHGGLATPAARELLEQLGRLRPYEGLLVSPHHRPFELLRLVGR